MARKLGARSDELVRRMGYQFRLTEVRFSKQVVVGKAGTVAIGGTNEGVAPFYYPWPVKLAWLDARGAVISDVKLPDDIRTWGSSNKRSRSASEDGRLSHASRSIESSM